MKKSKIIFSIGKGYRRIHAITSNGGYTVKVMSEREAIRICKKLKWKFGKSEFDGVHFTTFYDQSSHRIYRFYQVKPIEPEELLGEYCEIEKLIKALLPLN